MRQRVATKRQTISLFAGERKFCRPLNGLCVFVCYDCTLTHAAKLYRPQTDLLKFFSRNASIKAEKTIFSRG
jgi:hypothetical protein